MEDLKKKAIKKEGDPVNKLLNRRISIPLSIKLMKTRITPNQITALSLLSAVAAGVFFALGTYPFIIIGAFFVELYITLDLMDGEIARLKDMKSSFGKWFEGVCDNIATAAFLFGMTWGALQNPHLLPGMFELPLFYVFLIGMLALTGYYITGYSFYYGMICFQRELTGFIAPKGKARAILAIVKSYSRGLQILLFTFAGLLNQLLLGLLLFAVWSNLVWVGRLVKYSKNYRKKQ